MGTMTPKPRKQLSKREARTFAGRFALRFKSLLDERGWSTAEAASRFGLGEPAVRYWLRAQSLPATGDLERIGKALDTPEHPFPDYRELLPPS